MPLLANTFILTNNLTRCCNFVGEHSHFNSLPVLMAVSRLAQVITPHSL